MRYLLLLGRVFFSAIFILASLGHFSADSIRFAASEGVHFPMLTIPLTGIFALLGGLSILLGYRAKLGALLLILFIVPTTFLMHKFWKLQDPTLSTVQQVMFFKNLALLGGALILSYFGSGPFSLDALKKTKHKEPNHKNKN